MRGWLTVRGFLGNRKESDRIGPLIGQASLSLLPGCAANELRSSRAVPPGLLLVGGD
jgi:hypothetical protein